MKTLNKLALLILIFLKTTPLIIQTYKQIYNNVIKQKEELIEKTKQMIEADKIIKTNWMHEPQEYDEKIKARFKKQRQLLERQKNG